MIKNTESNLPQVILVDLRFLCSWGLTTSSCWWRAGCISLTSLSLLLQLLLQLTTSKDVSPAVQ